MEITGKLISRGETKEYGSNAFKKLEIVIETIERYPQSILIELHQNNTSLANGLNKDDLIKVAININGRPWTNPEGIVKYFNSIVAWKIEKIEDQAPVPEESHSNEESDDLPF